MNMLRNNAFPRRRARTSPWPILLLGLGLLGYAAFWGAERYPEYLGPLVRLSGTQEIAGPVSHVRDGDTIEVAGVPIRFGSLDCPERFTAAGRMATQRMKTLVSGQRLTCQLNGRTSYDRKIGSCTLPDGRDLAAAMIRSGLCTRYLR